MDTVCKKSKIKTLFTFPEIENVMPYWTPLTRKAPTRKFLSVWLSILFIWSKSKHPVHVMVLGVVINVSDFEHPFIFLHRLTLNMETYNKSLGEQCCCGSKWCSSGISYVWLQVGAILKSRIWSCLWKKFLRPHHP